MSTTLHTVKTKQAALNVSIKPDAVCFAVAEEALLDKTTLTVTPKIYAEFLAKLDKPPRPNKQIRKTMRAPACTLEQNMSITIILASHEVDSFDSGVKSLDWWLKERALKKQISGASHTYVACDDQRVLAYYALEYSTISVDVSSEQLRRNIRNQISVVMISRFAVDRSLRGNGIGRALVRDAGLRIIQAADTISIRGMMAHAISHEAKAFYEKSGFKSSLLDSMLLMVTIADLRASLY
jgi:GNAT superfamily N-acetyltransferase